MSAESPTRAPGPPVSIEESRLAVQRTFRETMLRHRKLGESVAVWEDGQVVEIPPEHITDRWEYIPGLPDELNPPFDQPAAPPSTNGHVHRGAGRRDAFIQGLVLGSMVTAGVAALIALLDERR